MGIKSKKAYGEGLIGNRKFGSAKRGKGRLKRGGEREQISNNLPEKLVTSERQREGVTFWE